MSISAACLTKTPSFGEHPYTVLTVLTAIQPTTADIDIGPPGALKLFNEISGYLAIDMGGSRKDSDQGSSSEMLHM